MSRRISATVRSEWEIQAFDIAPDATIQVEGHPVAGLMCLSEDELRDLLDVVEDALSAIMRLPPGRLDRMTNRGHPRWVKPASVLRKLGAWPYPPTDWTPPRNTLETFGRVFNTHMAEPLRRQLEAQPPWGRLVHHVATTEVAE